MCYTCRHINGKRSSLHASIYEAEHGPVPKGMQVHHIDGDYTNNALSNLEALTPEQHRRVHAGWFQKANGEWMRPCAVCGRFFPESEFWKKTDGKSKGAACKNCYRKGAKERARKYRAALKISNKT